MLLYKAVNLYKVAYFDEKPFDFVMMYDKISMVG